MKAIAAAVALALSAAVFHPALAQTGQPAGPEEKPSVLVDVSKVAGELATRLSIDPGRIPPGVDLPVEAAAEVCDATPDMLAHAAEGSEQIGCKAKSVSDDLVEALKKQLELRQNSGG